MRAMARWALLTAAVLSLAACGVSPQRQGQALAPSAEEMRSALQAMLKAKPEISIPEFEDSLKYNRPVESKGIVYIGSWNCTPATRSFEAVFSSPSIALYEISGSFQQDARGNWRAVPYTVRKNTSHSSGEFWRASDLDPGRI